MKRLALLVLTWCAVLGAAPRTDAMPIQWNLENVTFGPCWAQYTPRAPLVPCTPGGQATGWFVFDASTQEVTSWSISASGGDETVFPPFTWASGDPQDSAGVVPGSPDVVYFSGDAAPASLPWGYRPRQIRLDLATPLPDAYGTVLIDPSSVIGQDLGADCFACLPFRFVVSGYVWSTPPEPPQVPEPSTLLLLSAGLAAAVRAVRRGR
jgi:hypothetical protein